MAKDQKTSIAVCAVSELKPGERRVVDHDNEPIVVLNCAGILFAIEDRCTHEETPLNDGVLDSDECTIVCPRHGSVFDLRSGRPKSLPAFQPIRIFPVEVINEFVGLRI